MNGGEVLSVQDTQKRVFDRDGWKCCFPGCDKRSPNIELAHIIPNSKGESKRGQGLVQKFWLEITGQGITISQAEIILHSPLNLRTACKRHNQYFAESTNEVKQRRIVELYYCRYGKF